MPDTTLSSLSRSTSRRINWNQITDILRLTADRIGGERSDGKSLVDVPDTLNSEDTKVLQAAFQTASQAFREVLRPLRNLMRITITLLMLSIAVTIAGATLATITPWAGLVSAGGVISMFGLLTKAWKLARDQAMLELIPARYELALQVSTSKKQASTIINAFLRETTSGRK